MKQVSKLIKLTKFRARQRRGDVTKIAGRTGYSVSYVSRVLNGTCNNQSVINEAYRMTYRRKKNSEIGK
jgi:hypothetical protein